MRTNEEPRDDVSIRISRKPANYTIKGKFIRGHYALSMQPTKPPASQQTKQSERRLLGYRWHQALLKTRLVCSISAVWHTSCFLNVAFVCSGTEWLKSVFRYWPSCFRRVFWQGPSSHEAEGGYICCYVVTMSLSWLCIKMGSGVSHFDISLMGDGGGGGGEARQSQLLKWEQNRSSSSGGPSVYDDKPSSLPLGPNRSHLNQRQPHSFI